MPSNKVKLIKRIIWVAVFSISIAFVESVVVVYLRAIHYPEGFVFPLKPITDNLIGVEVLREFATMLILLSIAAIAGKKLWERFAYFLFCFGVWDIFYYVWLKVLLDWPSSIFEWDVLFLIPLPWIGPVIAPVSISLLMITISFFIIYLFYRGYDFRSALISRIFVLAGTGLILFSFMRDTDAAFNQQLPEPYLYSLLLFGELLYVAAFMASYLKTIRQD